MNRLAATTSEKRKRGIVYRTQDFKYPAIIEATTMSYKIEFDRDFDYISLSVWGALNLPGTRVCRSKLQEVLRAYDRTGVLVDATSVIAQLSAIEDYNFMKELRHEFPSHVSMALVVSRQRRAFGSFIETAAVNNGARLKSFTDTNEAVAWLMKQN